MMCPRCGCHMVKKNGSVLACVECDYEVSV